MDVDVALWSDQASQSALNLQGCCKSHHQWWLGNIAPSQQRKSRTNCWIDFAPLSPFENSTLVEQSQYFLTLLVSRQEKTQKVIPINYYMWMVETQSHTSYQALTSVLTNAKQWMVQPVAGSWYLPRGCETKIARILFLYQSEVYMWILGGTQMNKYMYVAHK